MMKMRRRPPKVVKRACLFCKDKRNPSFKEVDFLRQFTTERGKILGRGRSGVCSKHQRKLTLAIKHARHLALLPFIVEAR